MKDHYETLGLIRGSLQEEIDAAYRLMARQYGPGAGSNKPQYPDLYAAANEAYAVLGNPERRREYDLKWEQAQQKRRQQNREENSHQTPVHPPRLLYQRRSQKARWKNWKGQAGGRNWAWQGSLSSSL